MPKMLILCQKKCPPNKNVHIIIIQHIDNGLKGLISELEAKYRKILTNQVCVQHEFSFHLNYVQYFLIGFCYPCHSKIIPYRSSLGASRGYLYFAVTKAIDPHQ